MSVQITPEVEQLVLGIYAGGQFASEAEVLTTALQLLRRREQLRKDLKEGCLELEHGDRIDADEVFGELRERAAELDRRES
jgi:Arc/MetJ-type ribon-helix-helix transcriptional regulator